MKEIKIQKTYRGKNAGQWLSESTIEQSNAGINEIWVAKGVIARYHPDGMMLENSGGPVVVLSLSESQNEKFCELCELMDE